MDTTVPNPGSPEAQEKGCTCPVSDNGRGNEELGKIRGFYITQGCPLHEATNSQDSLHSAKDVNQNADTETAEALTTCPRCGQKVGQYHLYCIDHPKLGTVDNKSYSDSLPTPNHE